MSNCDQLEMKSKDFKYLIKLKVLNISKCIQLDLNLIFNYLIELRELKMNFCSQGMIKNESFKKLKKLEIKNNNQKQLNDELFKNINLNLKELNISNCKQFTDKGFQYLSNFKELKILDISSCFQKEITNEGFYYLNNLKKLKMNLCNRKNMYQFFNLLLKNNYLI
jgi:hypothetical protein